MSNNEEELREYIKKVLSDMSYKELGNQAETIKKNFSEEKFANNWNNILDKAYGAEMKIQVAKMGEETMLAISRLSAPTTIII